MNFEKPVLSGMFGKTPPREVIKLFDNTCGELESNQHRGEVLSQDNLCGKLHQHGEVNQPGQLNQPCQLNHHGQHHKPGEIIQSVNVTKPSKLNQHNSDIQFSNGNQSSKFADDWQHRDINELSDDTLTDQASHTFNQEFIVSQAFHEESEPSHTFDEESLAIHTLNQESKSKDITKSKTDSKLSKSHLKKGKNQTLKEEQASIALKFRETISVFENCDGIKMYQCKLCKECSFHFIRKLNF